MTVLVACRRCSYIWLYRGSSPYATCPDCGTSNNLTAEGTETVDAEEVL